MQCPRIFFVLLVLAPFGCAKENREPLYPVHGHVTFNGQPAAGVQVYFTAPDEQGLPAVPRAVTEADGSFELSTYAPRDGAPAGQYRVTIFWPDLTAPIDPEKGPPDRLNGRYADRKKSPWLVTVNEGPNDAGTFDLK